MRKRKELWGMWMTYSLIYIREHRVMGKIVSLKISVLTADISTSADILLIISLPFY